MANSCRRSCNCNNGRSRTAQVTEAGFGLLRTVPRITHHRCNTSNASNFRNNCGCGNSCDCENQCGCENSCGCGCGWNFPYYTGPCAPGREFDCPDYPMPCGTGVCPRGYTIRHCCCSQEEEASAASEECACNACCNGCETLHGMFASFPPISVSGNGNVCLAASGIDENDFAISNGEIVIPASGTYHAVFSVNVPEGVALDTTMDLTLNGTIIPATTTTINTLSNTETTSGYTGHAVFHANANSRLALHSSNAIVISPSVTNKNVFSLTLFRVR